MNHHQIAVGSIRSLLWADVRRNKAANSPARTFCV